MRALRFEIQVIIIIRVAVATAKIDVIEGEFYIGFNEIHYLLRISSKIVGL